jgi:hypothetical protein
LSFFYVTVVCPFVPAKAGTQWVFPLRAGFPLTRE